MLLTSVLIDITRKHEEKVQKQKASRLEKQPSISAVSRTSYAMTPSDEDTVSLSQVRFLIRFTTETR